MWLSNWIWVIPAAMVAFMFLFPTGELRSRRWRPAAWFVAGAFGLGTLGVLIGATRSWSHPFAGFSQMVTPPVRDPAFIVNHPLMITAWGRKRGTG